MGGLGQVRWIFRGPGFPTDGLTDSRTHPNAVCRVLPLALGVASVWLAVYGLDACMHAREIRNTTCCFHRCRYLQSPTAKS